jgi:exonuclease III
MKLVSWNCGVLGSDPKLLAVGDLIRSERPQILLIQETKMCTETLLKPAKDYGK